MTYRVGPKGQVVIPKTIRDALGIAPGDEVTFSQEGDAVVIHAARRALNLRGSFAGSGLTADLEREHRRELRR